jgi:RHS repeat-associated protein
MLRAPSRSPLAQLIARVLVVALVAPAIAVDATASLPLGEASKLTKSAFGELLAHTGSDPQPYAFTGEPYDPNVGFQYHRARWMDPRVGRFVGMDPWGGSPFDPTSLHRYLYARGEPLSRIDPTGRDSYVSTLIAVGARAILSAIAQLVFDAVLDAVVERYFADSFEVRAGVIVVQSATAAVSLISISRAGLRALGTNGFRRFMRAKGVHPPTGIWERNPLIRGREIENALARTDYRDWFHLDDIASGRNFDLVDFQKGRTLVSLKTTNAFTERSLADLTEHIDDLATRGATVDGLPADLVLDIRVPAGHEGLLRELIDYGAARGVSVQIKAYP